MAMAAKFDVVLTQITSTAFGNMCRVDQKRWPETYTYTVYDRTFGDFPAKNTVHTPYIYILYISLANSKHV